MLWWLSIPISRSPAILYLPLQTLSKSLCLFHALYTLCPLFHLITLPWSLCFFSFRLQGCIAVFHSARFFPSSHDILMNQSKAFFLSIIDIFVSKIFFFFVFSFLFSQYVFLLFSRVIYASHDPWSYLSYWNSRSDESNICVTSESESNKFSVAFFLFFESFHDASHFVLDNGNGGSIVLYKDLTLG